MPDLALYECWTAPEGSEEYPSLTVFPADHRQRAFLSEGMVPLYTIRASSWTEAMRAHYEIQEWAPYKPFDV